MSITIKGVKTVADLDTYTPPYSDTDTIPLQHGNDELKQTTYSDLKKQILKETTVSIEDINTAITNLETSVADNKSQLDSINETLGTSDISKIGDGTIKGAIVKINASGGSGSGGSGGGTDLTEAITAYVETDGGAASRDYGYGTYILIDNKLYTTKAISEGDTIYTSGDKQNVAQTNITDNIATLTSDINNANVLSILNNGFPTQTKTFSDDGTTITATSGDSDTLGWTLTKVFTDSFLTCTTTLKDAGENIKATLIKQFSADGKTISTVYNYEG